MKQTAYIYHNELHRGSGILQDIYEERTKKFAQSIPYEHLWGTL